MTTFLTKNSSGGSTGFLQSITRAESWNKSIGEGLGDTGVDRSLDLHKFFRRKEQQWEILMNTTFSRRIFFSTQMWIISAVMHTPDHQRWWQCHPRNLVVEFAGRQPSSPHCRLYPLGELRAFHKGSPLALPFPPTRKSWQLVPWRVQGEYQKFESIGKRSLSKTCFSTKGREICKSARVQRSFSGYVLIWRRSLPVPNPFLQK